MVAEEWNVESGELTPSMKLKRRVILERYKDEIDAMYGSEDGDDVHRWGRGCVHLIRACESML